MRHGSHIDPPNRFQKIHLELDPEQLSDDDDDVGGEPHRKIEYLEDDSQSIVSENRSPDIPFRYSVNPYRGCIHACSYCYARPTHEYLGMSAGLDFETKIVVKPRAEEYLRDFLGRPNYQPDSLVFSGVTDCYQPAERRFQLTRKCLELLYSCRHPVGLITKNALILRDLELLSEMAKESLVHVMISITTQDLELARLMEPRTSTPVARLRAVGALAECGVPVGVMVAPLIPGLNDHEVAGILQSASNAGASVAGYTLLRLPTTVQPVFEEWLRRTYPDRFDKVMGRLKQTRQGDITNPGFGDRMKGVGDAAERLRTLFHLFRRKYGLNDRFPAYDFSRFIPPPNTSGQLWLF